MLDKALEMLKALRSGKLIPEAEISEMVDELTSRGKELEHKTELSHLETFEEKECWRVAGELEEFI